jgi:hypothetical protein
MRIPTILVAELLVVGGLLCESAGKTHPRPGGSIDRKREER